MLPCDPPGSAKHFRPLPIPLLPPFTTHSFRPGFQKLQRREWIASKIGRGWGGTQRRGCCLRPASQSQAPSLVSLGKDQLSCLSFAFEG